MVKALFHSNQFIFYYYNDFHFTPHSFLLSPPSLKYHFQSTSYIHASLPLPFSAMSSLLCSQGVVLATAMAVSSTVIFFALRRQKPFFTTQFSINPNSGSMLQILPSSLSSDEKKRERMNKKKKRVHFADDVIEAGGNNEEFRSKANLNLEFKHVRSSTKCQVHGIPANRMALYKGILRDRIHRMI